MVKNIDRAMTDAVHSPESQKVKAEARRAAETLRNAGEQTVQDVRPQLVSALRQLNDELQRMINRMEGPPPPAGDDKPNSA